MKINLRSFSKIRTVVGFLLITAVFSSHFYLRDLDWNGTIHLHTLGKLVTAVMSLFIGILALVRFLTKQNTAFLFIGVGFFGAGLLEGYQGVVSSPVLSYAFPYWLSEPRWRWDTSNTFLSLLLFGSWLAWWAEDYTASHNPTRVHRIYEGVSLFLMVGALVFAILPISGSENSPINLLQVDTIISSLLYLLTLLGYLYKGDWRNSLFEYWLILALSFNLLAQAWFMPYSFALFDTYFVVAGTVKWMGHLFALIGLLTGMYTIFRESEQTAVQLTQTNEALQREFAERERAEKAEHEQRELAEALREVGNALNTTLDFNQLLNLLLDQTARVIPYDTANVMLVAGSQIQIVCTRGYERQSQIHPPQQFLVADFPTLQQMNATKQPLVVPDTAVHPAWVNAEVSPHVRSWAGAPIVVQGNVVAYLALNDSRPNFYRPEVAARLNAFAAQAAIAFQNAQLYEALEKRVGELTTLNTISQSINATLDLQNTLTIITEHTTRVLGVAATSVVLLDKELGDLWFAAASGQASDFVLGKRLKLGQGVIGWVAQNGKPALVADVMQDNRYFKSFDQESGFMARSILCVPLQSRGQTIGAVEALNKEVGTFTEEDLRLLISLTGPAATAIENAQLYAQAQQEINERKRVETALEAERALLARRVAERTADLSAANAELERAARLKDEFLASMSHELRTPLNAILGMSEALQEQVYGPMNENQLGSLRSIEESGRHLLALINDILDVSKIEAGKLELEIVPVQVESVCQASLRLIRQDAQRKRLRVHSSFDSGITTLRADERRLKQMLVNLLSNAVKFTPEGGEVGLEVVGDRANEVMQFTVWDTGIGIAQEDLGRLFRPFVQLDSSLSRQYSGTGLGLSLVYRMAELHGGGVAVESQAGNGSRFTLSLPWQEAEEHLLETAEMVETEDGHITHLAAIRRALIIDDSTATTSQLTRYLGELGVGVVVYSQGLGAVNQVIKVRPDIVLLDILLPGASGWEILAELKNNPETRHIPVLVISVVDNRTQALTLGADESLIKPISRQRLQRSLHRVLMRKIQAQQDVMRAEKPDTAPLGPEILLAEDNEANIQTISGYLIAKGCRLKVTRNGREAVDAANEHPPHIILMDIQMPGVDGLTAIHEIRALKHLDQTPIIALTALAMPDDRERCLAAGANAYLSKPVSLKLLMETIESLLFSQRS